MMFLFWGVSFCFLFFFSLFIFWFVVKVFILEKKEEIYIFVLFKLLKKSSVIFFNILKYKIIWKKEKK